MRERYTILLLLAFTLTIYMPSLKSGHFLLDDIELIKNMTSSSLTDLLQHSAGQYFRPLIKFTYIMDERLWGMKAAAMHLENILIHFFNALLIYLLVRLLQKRKLLTENSHWPLIAALLFVVHPVNTESVNWISGRTDPLASLFCLLALYLFALAWPRLSLGGFLFSALCLFTASLAKEVAFFIFPGCILILILYKPEPLQFQQDRIDWFRRSLACVPYLVGMVVYLYLRSAGFSRTDQGLGKIAESATSELAWAKLATIFSAFGFYLKKLVIPVPLNFAIDQINPYYFWVGLATALLSLALLWRRDLRAACILLIALATLPATLNAVLNFAWTPYAERYLYLQSALFAVALVPTVTQTAGLRKLQCAVIGLLFAIYVPATIQRNFLWADHLKLTEFTHAQSPNHLPTWNLYSIQLADAENYVAARNEFNKILRADPENRDAFTNLAKMELYINDSAAARSVLEPLFNGEVEPDRGLLNVMIEVNNARIASTDDPGQLRSIHQELIRVQRRLFELDGRPGHLLSAADNALKINDLQQAAHLVTEVLAMENVPDEVMSRAKEIFKALPLKGS